MQQPALFSSELSPRSVGSRTVLCVATESFCAFRPRWCGAAETMRPTLVTTLHGAIRPVIFWYASASGALCALHSSVQIHTCCHFGVDQDSLIKVG